MRRVRNAILAAFLLGLATVTANAATGAALMKPGDLVPSTPAVRTVAAAGSSTVRVRTVRHTRTHRVNHQHVFKPGNPTAT